MYLRTKRGSNQYQAKAEIIGAAFCKKCGKFINYEEYSFNPHPIKNPKPEYHEQCK